MTLLEGVNMFRNQSKVISSLCMVIALIVTATSNVLAADVAKLVEPCTGCHGKDGASTESEIPIIGGYSAGYITDTMVAFRDKERPCEETKIPAGPKKGESTDMCFVRAKQKFDPEKAKAGKKLQSTKCKKCHDEGGSLPDDDAGILAGQWTPYIKQQFKDYTSGARPMTKKMKAKFETLTEEEKENLIHFFASFQ